VWSRRPTGLRFIDRAGLVKQTGHPVPVHYRRPDEARSSPPPDAVIVCPATFNTINKFAAGSRRPRRRDSRPGEAPRHSNLRITLETYVHRWPKKQRRRNLVGPRCGPT
jgi:hypothetical protein